MLGHRDRHRVRMEGSSSAPPTTIPTEICCASSVLIVDLCGYEFGTVGVRERVSVKAEVTMSGAVMQPRWLCFGGGSGYAQA